MPKRNEETPNGRSGFLPLGLDDATPYIRAVSRLMELVAQHQVGERIPSERELSARFGMSRPTVRKALDTLATRDILESRHGSGTYVKKRVEPAARQETRLIGLSVPTLEVPTIARVVTGVERELAEQGYRLVLIHDEGEPGRQMRDVGHLLEREVEGLLIFLDRDNVVRPEYLDLLRQVKTLGKPVVLLDRYVPGVDLPCVLTDTIKGMYDATEHLIALGKRRFAVLSWGEEAGIAERNRFAGFRNALRDYGLPPEPTLHSAIGYGDAPETGARRAVERWIQQFGAPLPVDAIVCFLDNMAYGAFLALKEAGLRVPQDIALIGFDNVDSPLYRALGLELTSVDQPFAEMGRAAVQRILQQLRGEAKPDEMTRHQLLPPRLVVRSSCGESVLR